MTEPIEEKFIQNLAAAKQKMSMAEWLHDIYPVGIIFDALKVKQPPKCIFVPDRRIIRIMIAAVVAKDENITDERFILKFGLIEKENWLFDERLELPI